MELLSTFQLFYLNNGRMSLTNELLIVSDSEVPEEEREINLKELYEMIRYTKSHGLVSIQFLGVFGIFFDAGVKELKNAITELYKNLLYDTLSGTNNFNFHAISNFISRLSFSIKKSTLANIDRKEIEDAKKKKNNKLCNVCRIT